MLVHGTMDATGATFTSNNTTVAPGDWSFIRVGSTTIADSGILIMNSCQVQYAQYLYVYNGRAELTNTDLLNFSTYGVVINASGKMNMTGGLITTNSSTAAASGMAVYAAVSSRGSFSGVTLQNFFYGLHLETSAAVTIHNQSISNCKWPIRYYGPASLLVSGTSFFTGNVNTAALIDFTSLGTNCTLPTLNIPYYFSNTMTITATGRLVIGSGNILKFQIGYGITVDGKLRAEAAPGEFIYFTSIRDDNWGGDTNNDGSATAPATSNWPGIRFQNTSIDTANVLRRCKIRYSGNGSAGGVTMVDASPTIDQCDISNSYYGAYISNASNPIFSYNTIGSSTMTPIAMSFEANPQTINNTFSFSDNTYDAIGLLGGTLTANATIIKRNVTGIQNITYMMLNSITIPAGKILTINKGIVIKGYSSGHQFIVQGTLNAIATADSMITFTSSKDDNHGNPGDSNKDGTITFPVIGDWGGFIFGAGSTGTLDYCRIKYANVGSVAFSACSATEYISGCALGMVDASPVISNCEFKDLNYGISAYRASNPVISNNAMININNTPFNISGSSDPVFIGNTFTNVKNRAIGLLGGQVCQNGTIKKRDVAGYTNITYMLLSNMTIMSNTYVNVEPGVVIKSTAAILVDGGFKTDGTPSQKVIFTCITDDNEGNPMDSNGDGNATAPSSGCGIYIKFNGSSDDAYCHIQHATLKYPASYGIWFENAGGQVSQTTITNSSAYGFFIAGNSTPLIQFVTIQNGSSDPIAMSLLSNPQFEDITFSANGSNALRIIDVTLSSQANLYPRNIAGFTNIAYRFPSSLTINSNGKLTIQPGVVLKFESSSTFNIYGQLIAKGLPSNKIYFTSFHDDSKGGDSNNNGTASSPAWGQWGYYGCLNFFNSLQDSIVHCELSYGSTAFEFSNSQAYIKDCVIQQMSGYGTSIMGSSNPEFTDCAFYNIAATPVRMAMFSNPSFNNITALNIGYMAIRIIAETYSQSATIPMRNFAGYNNITYNLEGTCTVNSGTTITVPAGIVFKHSGTAFIVNGRLNCLGTLANPVVFTNVYDDAVGNPPDMHFNGSSAQPSIGSGYILGFNDVSNDSSQVEYTHFKYGGGGVGLISASPKINQCRFEKCESGVGLSGVSSPAIDNSAFHNLEYYPLHTSLLSYPSSLVNNTISGSTFKVILVQTETLTQDVTLPKRSFGGVSNIPYLFTTYYVGTSATLTIEPGVVCKFANGGWIIVNKGFIAEGGARADSNIVFTSIKDDFYGGDSNADSNATAPARGNWEYIQFADQSLDPLCRLKNCILRYSSYGIYPVSASPTITKSSITKNTYGCYATAAANPVFSQCDFDDNFVFAINNVNKTFMINATNCWWGSNLGPIQTNTPGNGTSSRELVTTAVNFTPFAATGATAPLMGDVSLNGAVQAFDASMVLQHVVGSTTLNPLQLQVGDVSFAAGVTAYDASLILQYVVGLIRFFPAELLKPVFSPLQDPQLIIGNADVTVGEEFTIPIRVINDTGMVSADVKIGFDPLYLEAMEVTSPLAGMNFNHSIDQAQGLITIALAGTEALYADTTLAGIRFRAKAATGLNSSTPLTVSEFLANEQDFSYFSQPGSVTVTDVTTGTGTMDIAAGMMPLYPNPFTGQSTLKYFVGSNNSPVTIEVFNLFGQKVLTLADGVHAAGSYSIRFPGEGTSLAAGIYLVKMTAGGSVRIKKVQVY
jgi:parallel beta-helix repeat protein